MNKTISKKMIIKAIQNEPLINGTYVEVENYPNSGYSTDPNCGVCAVGAVLRRSGMTNKKIASFGAKILRQGLASFYKHKTEESLIDYYINEKQYLNSLSEKFENLAEKYGCGKKTRTKLIKFVQENFPNKINLTPSGRKSRNKVCKTQK